MDIRLASYEDATQIYEINKASLGYEFPMEQVKERLNNIIKKECYRIYVACIKNEVVGYIQGGDYDCTYSKPLKNVLALAVDVNYQGQGIGRALLDTIEKWAGEDGCAGVRLVSSFSRVEAHEFYLHCDYIIRKDQKNFIKYF